MYCLSASAAESGAGSGEPIGGPYDREGALIVVEEGP